MKKYELRPTKYWKWRFLTYKEEDFWTDEYSEYPHFRCRQIVVNFDFGRKLELQFRVWVRKKT